jgi:hypothetical protein
MSDTSLTMALGFWDKMKTVYIYLQGQRGHVSSLHTGHNDGSIQEQEPCIHFIDAANGFVWM